MIQHLQLDLIGFQLFRIAGGLVNQNFPLLRTNRTLKPPLPLRGLVAGVMLASEADAACDADLQSLSQALVLSP